MERDVVIVRFVGDDLHGYPAVKVETTNEDDRYIEYTVVFEKRPMEGLAPQPPEFEGQLDLLADFVDNDEPLEDSELEQELDSEMPDLPEGD